MADPPKPDSSLASEVASFGPSAKIPAFWKPNPALWFSQVEFVFEANRITSSRSRFQLVAANLDCAILEHASDIISNPGDRPYEALKQRLLDVFTDSSATRIRRLLEDHQLGDERPSQFLRSLRRQGASVLSGDLLRELWLRGLPQRMQEHLATLDQSNLVLLAERADSLADVLRQPQVHAVSPTSESATLRRQVEQLQEEVTRLRRLLPTNRQRFRSPSPSRVRTSGSTSVCYYHTQYGEKARRCRPPCTYRPKN